MRVIYLLPLLLLTGCGYESPTWVPGGYSWQNDEYKAQPGPEAETLGYPYSAARNEYMNTMWQDVAAGLVDDLEAKTGITPQTLYIEPLPDSNAFNLSLDNGLREEFHARGYVLADSPAGVTHIKYQAFEKKDEKKRPVVVYNGDEEVLRKPYNPEKIRNFVFVLTLLQDGVPFGEARSERALPAYGYIHGEGTIMPPPRLMESGAVESPPDMIKDPYQQ